MEESKAWIGREASLGVLGRLWETDDILPLDEISVFSDGGRDMEADPEDMDDLLP